MTGIYVIRSGGHCKIGISKNPLNRMGMLQPGSPVPLSLEYVGSCEGSIRDLEATAHKILSQRRSCGEWFSVSAKEAVRAVMKAAKELDVKLVQSESAPPHVRKLLDIPEDVWRGILAYKRKHDISSESEAIRQMLAKGIEIYKARRASKPSAPTTAPTDTPCKP